jgi:hypothetical protein
LAQKQYKFSGHESFQCRHFWLKKGYDFISSGMSHRDEHAVIELGVGKNMVASIVHWMRVYGLIDADNELTDLAQLLYADGGFDPYMEDIGTAFLLHFQALRIDLASIYSIAFQDFRKTKITSDFTGKQLEEHISRRLIKEGVAFSHKSLQTDVKVFLRTYQTGTKMGAKTVEDDYASLLLGLGLFEAVNNSFIDGSQVYRFRYNEKKDLPALLWLYATLTIFPSQSSIAIEEVQSNVSDKFLCNREGTEGKVKELVEAGMLVFNEDAGRKELQIKSKLDQNQVLELYYGGV